MSEPTEADYKAAREWWAEGQWEDAEVAYAHGRAAERARVAEGLRLRANMAMQDAQESRFESKRAALLAYCETLRDEADAIEQGDES